jgi:pyridoxamine 5'-phosphate oxidase
MLSAEGVARRKGPSERAAEYEWSMTASDSTPPGPVIHGESLTRHTDYGQVSLSEGDVDPDPFAQLATWVDDAEADGVYEPNAMVIATIDPDGRPSSRTVLLRGVHSDGLEFFTDYTSRKGRALLANPLVSIVFPWYPQHRQVLIYGSAHPTTAEVSDAYFATRPHGSQIAATASNQSQPITDRAELEARVRELEERYPEGSDVPRPETWGGFRVRPDRLEFWQGRTSRLHDRIRYTLTDDGNWTIDRLQP